MRETIRGKKVLMMGLGILGGGVSTAKWLVKNGAILTITDLKDENYLNSSISALKSIKSKVIWRLGEHLEKDFLDNDIIVVNPDVPLTNKYLKLAKTNGKQIENELTLFYKFGAGGNAEINSVAITGTRGKTTSASWVYHFLKGKNKNTVLTGNSPEFPLLKIIEKCNEKTKVVIEEPSFLLEYLDQNSSHIALITNIFQDHLNRYEDISHYAKVKANIFASQTAKDYLILNQDNKWTSFYLKLKPKSKVLFFSTKNLKKGREGIFCAKNGDITLDLNNKQEIVINSRDFVEKWGRHNLENLLGAVLVAKLSGLEKVKIKGLIETLPGIKFRQELVYSSKKLKIYNDTNATSPEATISAIERFKKNNMFLILGGTDRDLDFSKLIPVIKKLDSDKVFFLDGSATKIILDGLKWKNPKKFQTLKDCVEKTVLAIKGEKKFSTIVFSPASKSFEKFKNEFDRGEQFNKLVKKYANIK